MAIEGPGDEVNAKQDTVLYLKSGSATVDESQEATDLTAGGSGGAYESPSARTALSGPFTLYIRVPQHNESNAANPYLIHTDTVSTGNAGWQIRTNASGRIRFMHNAGATVFLAPAIGSGDKDLHIAWAVAANPLGSGSAAMLHDFYIYNVTDSRWEQFAHRVYTATFGHVTTADELTVGGWYNGTDVIQVHAAQPSVVQISKRYHSGVEIAEDWLGQRTAPATDLPMYWPRYALDTASGIANEGEYIGGPQLGLHNNRLRQHRRKTVGTFVNETYLKANPLALTESVPFTSAVEVWRAARVPDTVGKIRARVNILMWHAGGDTGGDIVIGMDSKSDYGGAPTILAPGGESPPPPPVKYTATSATLTPTTIEASATPQWVDLGEIPIARSPDGWTYLNLRRYSLENGAGESATVVVLAWQAWGAEKSDSGLQWTGPGLDDD